jgi:hypothetical protein
MSFRGDGAPVSDFHSPQASHYGGQPPQSHTEASRTSYQSFASLVVLKIRRKIEEEALVAGEIARPRVARPHRGRVPSIRKMESCRPRPQDQQARRFPHHLNGGSLDQLLWENTRTSLSFPFLARVPYFARETFFKVEIFYV